MKFDLILLSFIVAYLSATQPISSEEGKQKYKVASDYPLYMNFNVTENLYITIRLETKGVGNYQIVLGSNDYFPSKFASILSIRLNGEYHKEIEYKSIVKEGRVFLEINFSIKNGDAYRNQYVDCFISLLNEKRRKLNSKDKILLNSAILEFGFKKL
ncbi:hypothetical protein EHQ12_07380 [Leptospira gomenensis]|uniref:Uncharacterized protein n=1 Tax=Leptospira gomenensis TaxID=2484974 RepID=A0A5F1Z0C4_9LEPT|nr:hypothetical protein [Leptospira gomenensis]TGK35475.1 hypothetical protein EHQ17_05935 [Leptospira gomenensis]TGK40633.1 hypothetical protein EHQ12_07380 [Leptospira gomenensis]TGK46311.1 hypothetical protein EHQ07_06550 [Leptospira gomenensis]TGK66446.1 hypothetical protein EHQ13_02955 [Leptospira gomenensis]